MKQLKTTALIAFTLIALALTSFAQKDDEVSVEFVARNAGIPKSISADNLSFGFKAGYTHYLGRKNGRGDFGIGVEVSPTFSGSNLALLRGAYIVKYQANGNKKFQPFVKGSIGIACDHWKKKLATSPTNTGCPALSYGGGVGVDIPLKEGSRKAVRIGVEYFTTNFRNPANGFAREIQHNVEAGIGLRF